MPAGYKAFLQYEIPVSLWENRKDVWFACFIAAVPVLLDLQNCTISYWGHLKTIFAEYFITENTVPSDIILNLEVEAIPTNTTFTNFVPYVTVCINLLSGCQYKPLFWWFVAPILLKGKASIKHRGDWPQPFPQFRQEHNALKHHDKERWTV